MPRNLLGALSGICTDQLRTGFAGYAETHEAASIRRCWSTWNVLCTCLFAAELIPAALDNTARRLDDAGLCRAVRWLSPPTPR